MKNSIDDLTTWSDSALMSLVEELRTRITTETNEDMRTMKKRKLDAALAEVRRRNALAGGILGA